MLSKHTYLYINVILKRTLQQQRKQKEQKQQNKKQQKTQQHEFVSINTVTDAVKNKNKKPSRLSAHYWSFCKSFQKLGRYT